MLDDLIDYFNLTITLRVVWRGKVLFYPKFFTKFCEANVVKLFSVIRHDGMWYLEPAYDIIPYEFNSLMLIYFSQGFNLHPFSGIIDRHDCELCSSLSSRYGSIK